MTELEAESRFDRAAEAARLLRWASKATEVCTAWQLNQLAHPGKRGDEQAEQQADKRASD